MMNAPKISIAVAVLLTSAQLAPAQAQGQPGSGADPAGQKAQSGDDEVNAEDTNKGFFQVTLSDGGAYMVALSRITSIAKHEYIVDGSVRVNELSITAEGATITRFYYLEPVSDKSPSNAGQVLIDRVRSTSKELATRTGTTDALNAVSKSYPDGTHSHNVEFRLKNKANVAQLYNAVYSAWWNGRGTKVTVSTKK